MPRAVRFDKYGGLEVLEVVEVDRPIPGPAQALVRVKAAGINPGEASIRKGLFADRWPSTFPSGQGSDLAGIVEELGPGVTGVAVGDEVIGYLTIRSFFKRGKSPSPSLPCRFVLCSQAREAKTTAPSDRSLYPERHPSQT